MLTDNFYEVNREKKRLKVEYGRLKTLYKDILKIM